MRPATLQVLYSLVPLVVVGILPGAPAGPTSVGLDPVVNETMPSRTMTWAFGVADGSTLVDVSQIGIRIESLRRGEDPSWLAPAVTLVEYPSLKPVEIKLVLGNAGFAEGDDGSAWLSVVPQHPLDNSAWYALRVAVPSQGGPSPDVGKSAQARFKTVSSPAVLTASMCPTETPHRRKILLFFSEPLTGVLSGLKIEATGADVSSGIWVNRGFAALEVEAKEGVSLIRASGLTVGDAQVTWGLRHGEHGAILSSTWEAEATCIRIDFVHPELE